MKRRVAILISGRGSNMAALIEAATAEDFPAEIAVVIANRADAGPIVMQGAVAVSDDDSADTLAARILQIEHRIYPDALRLVASGKIRIEGDVCKMAGSAGGDGALISPTAS